MREEGRKGIPFLPTIRRRGDGQQIKDRYTTKEATEKEKEGRKRKKDNRDHPLHITRRSGKQ